MSTSIDEVEAGSNSRRKGKIWGRIALGATAVTLLLLIIYHLQRPPFRDDYGGDFVLIGSIATYTVGFFASLIATKFLSRSILPLLIALAGIIVGVLFVIVYPVWISHADFAGLAGLVIGMFLALSLAMLAAIVSIVVLVRSPTQGTKKTLLLALIGVIAIPVLFVLYEILKLKLLGV